MHFNELVEERIISETKKDDYMPEKEEQNPRVEVDTMEKCNEELDRVLLKYNELAVLSKKGVNVIEELDLLKNRILILRAIKELILKKKHLEIKISNSKSYLIHYQSKKSNLNTLHLIHRSEERA